MSPKVIIAWLVGAVLLAVLFFLPKAVVTKQAENSAKAPVDSLKEAAQASEQGAVHIHKDPEITGEIASAISQYLGNATKATNANVAASWYDSAAARLYKIHALDSAMALAKLSVQKKATPQRLSALGALCFDAAMEAGSEESRKALTEQAQSQFNQALKLNPSYLEAKTRLALTYVESPNPMQGITMLRQVLEQDPENVLALQSIGQMSIRTGQWDKAVGRFEKLTKINPNDSQAWYFLGTSYKNLGKATEARKAFNTVVKLNQDPEAVATAKAELASLK